MLHTNEHIIKHKVGLLNLAEELGNVSKACHAMGLSQDTFYRYKQAVEEGGVEALLNKSRRKAKPKNWLDEAVTLRQFQSPPKISPEVHVTPPLTGPAGSGLLYQLVLPVQDLIRQITTLPS